MKKDIEIYEPGKEIFLDCLGSKMYIQSVLISASNKIEYKLGFWKDGDFKTTWVDAEALQLAKTNPLQKVGFLSQ